MIHYHGLPLRPGLDMVRSFRGRHAMVSFEKPDQVDEAAEVCQSVTLDNGAFSAWRSGKPYDFARERATLVQFERRATQHGAHRMNIGHGHVFPRSDGVKARCGGPMVCRECARDFVRKHHGETAPLDGAAAAVDQQHSDDFVVMFLGYLTAALPELHQVEAPRVLETWTAFKREMGKREPTLRETALELGLLK